MLSWFRKIDRAETISEVLAITRDYLATWSPEALARLPAACRPRPMRDEHDLEKLHESLVEEYRSNRAEGEDLLALQQLTSFMVRASVRVAQVKGDAGGGGGEPPADPASRHGAARDDD